MRELYLRGTAVTDAGLARLQGLPGLQVLSLDDTRVTAAETTFAIAVAATGGAASTVTAASAITAFVAAASTITAATVAASAVATTAIAVANRGLCVNCLSDVNATRALVLIHVSQFVNDHVNGLIWS